MNSSDTHHVEAGNSPGELKTDTTNRTDDPTEGFEPPQLAAESLTGKALGDYLLLEQIGAGGGGYVYRAQHRPMDRIVALKIFARGVLGDEVQIKRFYREVRAAAKLVHPNIVMAFDAGEYRSIHYLVMEYVDGQSLANLVQSQGPLSVRRAAQYIVQAAQGLAYAHGEGIVHRDVKPDNIMVDRSGTVKLLDMGLARWQGINVQEVQEGASTSLTAQGIVLGTVGYISPEQISDAGSADERSDIYSLGCTLYCLLTGRPPYKGTILEIFRAHAEAPIPCLKHARNDVPYGLDTTYQRMLAKDPNERPASVKEVMAALQAYCTEQKADAATSAAKESVILRKTGVAADVVSKAGQVLGFDMSAKFIYVSSINEDGEPVLVKDSDGALATPAVLLYRRGAFAFGKAALKAAEASPDDALIENLTWRLGVAKSPHRIADQPIPDEALTAILASKRSGSSCVNPECVLCYTIPGSHGEVRRRAFRDAYFIATGSECKSVNVSMAVATQFCFLHGWLNPYHKTPVKNLLVFRCGSHSFDATVYRVEDRRLSALTMAGSPEIGECSWDNLVIEQLLDKLEPGPKQVILADKKQTNKLRRQIDEAKAALAKGSKRVTFRVRVGGEVIQETVSYQSLGRLGDDITSQLKKLTERAVSESGTAWENLDHVLLSGSAARMPFVQESVKQWIGNRDICSLAGPEIASGGAALVAENSLGTRHETLDFQLQDIASHSYGIRITDDADSAVAPEWVIARGTPLPATARGTVAKHTARQLEINFEVVETGGFNPNDITVLGSCRISNLPPGLPIGAGVEVEFALDASGILSVFAVSLATGRRFIPAYQTKVGMSAQQRAHWRSWLQALG